MSSTTIKSSKICLEISVVAWSSIGEYPTSLVALYEWGVLMLFLVVFFLHRVEALIVKL
jgi:hypothetical protein